MNKRKTSLSPRVLSLHVLLLLIACLVVPHHAGEDGDGFAVEILHVPSKCPQKIKEESMIVYHVVGKIKESGEVFENTHLNSTPVIGQYKEGFHVDGLFEGMISMCIGEKRRITVPSQLGYGEKDFLNEKTNVKVPANSDLVFEVELKSIEEIPPTNLIFEQLTKSLSDDGESAERVNLSEFIDLLSDKMELDDAKHSLPFPVDKKVLALMKEALLMADSDGDGMIDVGEFGKSPLFNHEDPNIIEELDKKVEAQFKDEEENRGTSPRTEL